MSTYSPIFPQLTPFGWYLTVTTHNLADSFVTSYTIFFVYLLCTRCFFPRPTSRHNIWNPIARWNSHLTNNAHAKIIAYSWLRLRGLSAVATPLAIFGPKPHLNDLAPPVRLDKTSSLNHSIGHGLFVIHQDAVKDKTRCSHLFRYLFTYKDRRHS